MKTRFRLLLALVLATLAADQVTKFLVVSHLTSAPEARGGVLAQVERFVRERPLAAHPRGAVEVVEGFWVLRYVENPGAAAGVLSRLPEPVRTPLFHGVSLLALGFILWACLWLEAEQRLLQVALSLVLGGAVGNYLDRLLHGSVIDFVDWHWRDRPDLHWPTFNLADAAISVGVSFLVLELLRVRRAGPLGEPARPRPVLRSL